MRWDRISVLIDSMKDDIDKEGCLYAFSLASSVSLIKFSI